MGLFSSKVDQLKKDLDDASKVAAQHRRVVAQEKADKAAAKSAAKVRLKK